MSCSSPNQLDFDNQVENTCFSSSSSSSSNVSTSPEDEYSISGTHDHHHLCEDGHVYALATCGEFLYTCTESKNIRVWKNLEEYSGFKSKKSGLVKAIIVSGEKVFTGHQDGKIRVWKFRGYNKNKKNKKKKLYKRLGSLPTVKDCLKTSVKPKSYVRGRRNRNVPWIKHFDAVSCIAIDVHQGLLYSGSWDKSVKVWRISDSKCLESIKAHDDAVNTVVVGFDGLIFTGSADGTLKMWRRNITTADNHTKHVLANTLLKQETAVTSLAADMEASVVYAGSSDGLVHFWEREKWDHVIAAGGGGGILRGHKIAVLCLAVGGSLVCSGSVDMSICVWKREEGGVHTCLSVLTGHDGPVKCLAIEKDIDNDDDNDKESSAGKGWVVYSGSLDKTVKVWRVLSEPDVYY